MIIKLQSRTFSVALTYTQGQTSKKAHKILISQTALKLQPQAYSQRQGAQGGQIPSPIEMPPMIKISQKSLISSFFSVSFSIFPYNTTRPQQ